MARKLRRLKMSCNYELSTRLLTIKSGLSVILVKVVFILFNIRFNAGRISSEDQSMFGKASNMNLKREVI